MTRIFGAFIDEQDERVEYLQISFSPTSIPLQQRWRNNGLSADFLADYLTTFFPGEERTAADTHTELKDAVSFIANELLENAMKFTYAPSQHAISIAVYLEAHAVSLYTTNSVNPHTVEAFQHLITRLLTEDSATFYLEQLTRNAEEDPASGSGVGLLTMLTNYGATLAWKFAAHAEDPDVLIVTTMVRLTV
jgi:hypothetical protein